MTRVLVLRPEPGASATVARARSLGLHAVAVPLFTIEPIAWEGPEPAGFDGVLLTSANAIRAGSSKLEAWRGLPAFTVGEATAEAARAAGFDIAATGDSGVERLLGSLEPGLKLLHFRGEDAAAATARQALTPVIVYRATPVEKPPLGDLRNAVALIHSPRAARRFAELAMDRETITIAAISKASADASGPGWKAIAVSEHASDEALLALTERLCNNLHR